MIQYRHCRSVSRAVSNQFDSIVKGPVIERFGRELCTTINKDDVRVAAIKRQNLPPLTAARATFALNPLL